VNKRGFSNDPTIKISQFASQFQEFSKDIQSSLVSLERIQSNSSSILISNQCDQHKSLIVSVLKGRVKENLNRFQKCMKSQKKNQRERNKRMTQFSHPHSSQFSSVVTSIPHPSPSSDAPSTGSYALFEEDIESGVRNRKGQGMELELEQEQELDHKSLRARNQGLFQIEKALQEVSTLYAQFFSLLQSQGEVVERLDDEADLIQENTLLSLSTLKSVAKRVRGERSFILKIFGALIVAIIVLVVFFR